MPIDINLLRTEAGKIFSCSVTCLKVTIPLLLRILNKQDSEIQSSLIKSSKSIANGGNVRLLLFHYVIMT